MKHSFGNVPQCGSTAFLVLVVLFASVLLTSESLTGSPGQFQTTSSADCATPGRFVDVTQRLVISFQHQASHTSRKYLPETMGSGVALFDYDNHGRLDIFFVSVAPLGDRAPKGTIPRKSGPNYCIRLSPQQPNV